MGKRERERERNKSAEKEKVGRKANPKQESVFGLRSIAEKKAGTGMHMSTFVVKIYKEEACTKINTIFARRIRALR